MLAMCQYGAGMRFLLHGGEMQGRICAMTMSEFTILAVAWMLWATVFGLFGWAVGRHKGRGADGAWLGILLGLLGVVVTAILPPIKPKRRRAATPQVPVSAAEPYRPDPMEVWEAAEKAKSCIRPLPGYNRQSHAQNQTGDGEGN